jgi:hypothetical protein
LMLARGWWKPATSGRAISRSAPCRPSLATRCRASRSRAAAEQTR